MSSPADALASSAAWSAHDRWLRRRLLDRLAGLRGRITLRDAEGEVVIGTPEPGAPALACTIDVLDPGFYRAVAAIGSVGDRDITVNQYTRALQSDLKAFGAQLNTQISLQDALKIGLDGQTREKLVTTAAMDGEADRVGLSVGDIRVAKEVTDIAAFKGAGGTFDREAYRATLQNND